MIRSTMAGILLTAIFSAQGGVEPVDRPPIDVYLIAGQSNAAGQGQLSKLPSHASPDPRVRLFHSRAMKSQSPPLAWAPLRSASEAVDKFGPEISFGNRIRELTKDRPVGLIKHAMTSTELQLSWNPGLTPTDPINIGPQFKEFASTVEAGLKGLRDEGFEPTLRGMIWQQGETDASYEQFAWNYCHNLSHFIARVREQFNAPNLVFVYGFILPPPNTQTYREIVRTAQGAIDQDSGSNWAVKNAFTVFTDDLLFLDPHSDPSKPKDTVHFGTFGTWELGRRMAETMARKGKLGR